MRENARNYLHAYEPRKKLLKLLKDIVEGGFEPQRKDDKTLATVTLIVNWEGDESA